jgi:hypothetical protein
MKVVLIHSIMTCMQLCSCIVTVVSISPQLTTDTAISNASVGESTPTWTSSQSQHQKIKSKSQSFELSNFENENTRRTSINKSPRSSSSLRTGSGIASGNDSKNIHPTNQVNTENEWKGDLSSSRPTTSRRLFNWATFFNLCK